MRIPLGIRTLAVTGGMPSRNAGNVNPAVNRQPGFRRGTLRASAEWTDKAHAAWVCVFLEEYAH